MSKLERRRIISTTIDFCAVFFLWIVGAGAWALVAFILSLWAFYDGLTRCELEDVDDRSL